MLMMHTTLNYALSFTAFRWFIHSGQYMLTGLGQYMLYMLEHLFTPFDTLAYSIEGRHQRIKFRLSTYAYIHSC